MVRLFLILSFILISGCAERAGLNLGYYPDPTAAKEDFIYCYGYGCRERVRMGFTPKQWKAIQKTFKPVAKNPDRERQQIARAIALMEKYTGALAGTQDDQAKAPIVRQTQTELDCIDETINTTKYLTFLQEDGLLKFHQLSPPVHKGLFINGVYPHNSASIQEVETDNIYVVDSYIYKNGEQPNIRPLKNWKKYRVEDLPKN